MTEFYVMFLVLAAGVGINTVRILNAIDRLSDKIDRVSKNTGEE